MRRDRLLFVLFFLGLLVIRIPFFLLHHLQEDSYITFRTAFNLADHGSFSFNLGEHTPATTSLIYPFGVALLRLAFHSQAIHAVQVFGSILAILASYVASVSISKNSHLIYPLWILLASSSMSLYTGYSGMETSLVILAVSLLLYVLRFPDRHLLGYVVLFLLPLLRPDAIAFGFIFSAVIALNLTRIRQSLVGLSAMFLGIAALLTANVLLTGRAITGTILAKQIAYHPSHSLAAIFERAKTYLFFEECFLYPTPMRPWVGRGPFLVALLLVVLCVLATYLWRQKLPYAVFLAATASIILVPIAFVVGGTVFPWYLYPSNWLAQLLVFYCFLSLPDMLNRRSLLKGVLVGSSSLALLLFFGELVHAVRAEAEDYHYRGDVGRLLGEISNGHGTLFLEPAGYIPFFSGLKTQDEVGLVDLDILTYMKRFPQRWWIEYVMQRHPTYLVQRESFNGYKTYQNYQLTTDEIRWFNSHYKIVRHFYYSPKIYYQNSFLQRVAGSSVSFATEYIVFQSIGH